MIDSKKSYARMLAATAIAVITVVLGLSSAASAGATDPGSDGDYTGNSTTTTIPVRPEVVVLESTTTVVEDSSASGEVINAEVEAATASNAAQPSAESLAFTGGDATRLALIAGVLVLLGVGAVVLQRRRSAA